MASNQLAMASTLLAMTSSLLAMTSNLLAMASTLQAMALHRTSDGLQLTITEKIQPLETEGFQTERIFYSSSQYRTLYCLFVFYILCLFMDFFGPS